MMVATIVTCKDHLSSIIYFCFLLLDISYSTAYCDGTWHKQSWVNDWECHVKQEYGLLWIGNDLKKKKEKNSDIPRRIKKSEFYDELRGEEEVQN